MLGETPEGAGDRYVEQEWIFAAQRVRGLCRHGTASLIVRPLGFWLYVLMGVVMIIASAIAMPFIPARSR